MSCIYSQAATYSHTPYRHQKNICTPDLGHIAPTSFNFELRSNLNLNLVQP